MNLLLSSMKVKLKSNLMYTEIIKEDNNHDAFILSHNVSWHNLNLMRVKKFKFRWLSNRSNSIKLIKIPEFYLSSENKNVLIWGEQGLGDEIFFLRFLSKLEPYVHNSMSN